MSSTSIKSNPRRRISAPGWQPPIDVFDKYTWRTWRGAGKSISGFEFCLFGGLCAVFGAVLGGIGGAFAVGLLGLFGACVLQGLYLLRITLRRRTDWGAGPRLALFFIAGLLVVPCVAFFCARVVRHGLRASVGEVYSL